MSDTSFFRLENLTSIQISEIDLSSSRSPPIHAKLHRLFTRTHVCCSESIDGLTIPSKRTPGTVLKRVEEVFDCWFESGSMPYAQVRSCIIIN